MITADFDLVTDDDLGYRAAFIQAFRRRAIYPRNIRTLSVESLLWRNTDQDGLSPSTQLESLLARMRGYAEEQSYIGSRQSTFHLERVMRLQIHGWLKEHFTNGGDAGRNDASYMGLDPACAFEVRSARIAYRTSPDGGVNPQLLISIQQRKVAPVNAADPNGAQMMFEGGCMLIADLGSCRIRYCIRKDTNSQSRLERQQAFAATSLASGRAVYFGRPSFKEEIAEPFAAIHRGF